MAVQLPLDKMTVEEKLDILEQVWEDLCRSGGADLAPEWHAKVLAEREAAIARGEAAFESLDEFEKRVWAELR